MRFFLLRVPEAQSIRACVPMQTSHYSRIKRGHKCKIVAISVTILTNVMRNFNDRLQEYINVEGRHLPGIFFL